jgi:hypothetical protein
MVLSYSRDPFCCYVTGMDAVTRRDCHVRAFEHFGGVPASVACDRVATVVRRHVAAEKAVPRQPDAVAFAGHDGFDIDVLAAYRPTGKGRAGRGVLIARDHVLAGRTFRTVGEADAAFAAWDPIRRAQAHRTHAEAIGDRAVVDHAALRPRSTTAAGARHGSAATPSSRPTTTPTPSDSGPGPAPPHPPESSASTSPSPNHRHKPPDSTQVDIARPALFASRIRPHHPPNVRELRNPGYGQAIVIAFEFIHMPGLPMTGLKENGNRLETNPFPTVKFEQSELATAR